MKKKLLSILLSLAMVVTMMPAQTLVVSAAIKTKATVSTQAGLKKALKNKKLKTLTVKTAKAKTFNINKGTYKKVHMIIDAPNSTVKNKSTFKKITIKQNKTLVMDTSKGNIVVSKGGKVNEVKLTKKNSKIDFKVNGELKKISVEKKSEINLNGATKKPVVVNAGKNSDETIINTSVKVNANIESNSKVVLSDGSEGSSIAVTNKDVLVTVVNTTDASYTATDANGKTVEIKKDETVVIGGYTPSPTPIPRPTPTPEKQKTFKAVYNTTEGANTLTFYYDSKDHSGENITVYEGSSGENYLFDNTKVKETKWGYNGICRDVKSVVIDSSVASYSGLTYTAYMFVNMTNANNITGAENLDVSNVTDMSYMFTSYGNSFTTLSTVPNVSEWNTAKVTNMSYMFQNYGAQSTKLAVVPDVSKWNTSSVTNLAYMFRNYGSASTALNAVPAVNRSNWNTGNVTDMSGMFYGYGSASTALNAAPDMRGWNTGKVTNMSYMFQDYGKKSAVLTAVPDVSTWNTGNVTDMSYMFKNYGLSSTELNAVPAVDGSNWNTVKVTNMAGMFESYGSKSTALTMVPNVKNWKTSKVTSLSTMFKNYGSSSEVLEFKLDLSGWSVESVTATSNDMFTNGDIKTTTWSVTIPAKTGDRSNETEKWYVGDGTDESKFIAPTYGKKFTLAGATTKYTVTFDLNGIIGTAPEKQTIEEGGCATEPTENLPSLENHTLQWFTKAETIDLSDKWEFNTPVTENITLYAQWTRTLESIISTNDSFPTSEWSEAAPEDAWVNGKGNGYKAFKAEDSGELIAIRNYEDDPLFNLYTGHQLIKIGDTYVYEAATGLKVTCSMEEGKFVSFVYNDTRDWLEVVTGTYAPGR